MEDNKRLVKNTILITLGNFGAKFVAFLLLPLYTAYLTTSEYGNYDFIIAISSFLLPIVTFSIHEALFRFTIDYKNDEKKFNELITNSLGFIIIGMTIFLTILLIIKYFFQSFNYLIYLFLYVSVNSLFGFTSNLLRGMGNVKFFSIITSLKNIFQLILNVICVVVLKTGVSGLLISFIISEFIAFVVISIKIKLIKKIKLKSFNIKKSFYLLKYSLPLIPNTIGAQIINLSDRFIISLFMGTSSNGIYSISYKFPNIIDTMYHFFYMAWSENASIVFNKGINKAKEYYVKLYYEIDRFIFSIIMLIISCMPILFRILIKGEYSEGFNYIWILLIAMYFNCLAKFYSGIYTALKKTKVMATSTITAAIINLLINIIFIKKYGLYAAAYSTLISEIVLFLIRKIRINNFINIKEKTTWKFFKLIYIVIIVILYDYNNKYKIMISTISSACLFIVINKKIIYQILKKVTKKGMKK